MKLKLIALATSMLSAVAFASENTTDNPVEAALKVEGLKSYCQLKPPKGHSALNLSMLLAPSSTTFIGRWEATMRSTTMLHE